MSDDKYRQLSSTRKNCKQGHWTGTPSGGTNDGGCWLCRFGCAILSYLKWKGLEPNEANVTKYLNQNADADWGKMGIEKKTELQTPCIGKFKSKSHFVYIESNNGDNCSIFDPGKRSNTSMKKNEFVNFYY